MSDEIDVLDLLELFKEQGFIKKFRGERNGNVQCTCPRPHYKYGDRYYEDVPSLGIQTEEPYLFNCFSCGFKGTIEYFVADTMDMTIGEAKKFLELRYKFDEDYWRKNPRKKFKDYEDLFKPEDFIKTYEESYFKPFRRLHNYTLDRGIEKDMAIKYEIGYDDNQRRVVIPIRTSEGKIAGLIGRTIDSNEQAKYLLYNYDSDGDVVGFDREWVIYEDRSGNTHDAVLVVESILDVVWAEQNGLTEEVNVASILGSKLTDTQADKLAKYREVICGLDNDYGGYVGQKGMKNKLEGRVKLTKIEYPEEKKDLGDCGKELMFEMVENRHLLVMDRVKKLKKRFD